MKRFLRSCRSGTVLQLALLAISSPLGAQVRRGIGLATSVAGTAGERKTGGEINGGIWPLARVDSRVQNRVQSRIHGRIEQDDRDDDTPLASFNAASQQVRRGGRPR